MKKILILSLPILIAGMVLFFVYNIFSIPKEAEIKDMVKVKEEKFCNTADNCVVVACGCDCSGCGGFSYDDVVNKNYKDKWYEENNCKDIFPRMCPEVCCPKREKVCKNNICKVKEGS
ncbi:MAG: hypothetical protein HQ541_12800, partial [Mariniphaga sp.]|nr:hypothetical protein [Mariniphaga sp.]